MGTDIHIAVEARWKDGSYVSRHDRTKWIGVTPPPIPHCDKYGSPLYDNRNYALFDFLSGVRYHSARSHLIPTRGLPADIDKESEVWEFHDVARSGLARMQRRHAIDDGDPLWIGDYGHTWATVGELLDLPWNETMTDFGDESLNGPMSQQCDYFIQWLKVLNDWWGRDNCRVIWGFDS